MFSTFLVSQLQLRTRSMEHQEELLNRTRCRSHCEKPPEALPDQVWLKHVWVYGSNMHSLLITPKSYVELRLISSQSRELL